MASQVGVVEVIKAKKVPSIDSPSGSSVNEPYIEEQAPCNESYITFLLLGLDARRKGPARSDAIMVVTANQQTGSVRVLSIPRDLLIDLRTIAAPSLNMRLARQGAKINTAYFWGEYLHYPGGGLPLAKRAVAEVIGINIDHAAAIDMEGFGKLVDALGGVDVYVESALVDERYGDFYSGRKIGLNVPAGWQHMDGARARDYVRSRYADDDFARMGRQRELLRAIVNKLLTPGSLLKLPVILNSLRAAIITDLPLSDIPAILDLARKVDRSKMESMAIGREEVTVHGDGITEYWLDVPAERLRQHGTWLRRGCND
jgi:LCP family protein required for cell wall assembly